MTLFLWLALIVLLLHTLMTLAIIRGIRRVADIKDIFPLSLQNAPRVSVIIPACNEANTIEPALQSVLELDYPDLEIIVINDRSTDNTEAVLTRMQRRCPRLRLLNLTELPDGWMGKSHALHRGAEQASGDYLLFTDADIILEKTTLSRAMSHMLATRLDHLCLIFRSISPGGLLNALFAEAACGLLLRFAPWKVKEKNNDKYMGVGGFNLVKTSTYRAIGGHRSFAMHPIDDLMLGKVIKQHGFSQDCLFGSEFVQIQWYATVSGYIDGVMKNTFALFDFSVARVVAAIAAMLVLNILPFWAFLAFFGWVRALFGAVLITRILLFAIIFYNADLPLRYALWSLITPYVTVYIVLKATISTIVHRGITWRGTFYPLDEMRLS